MNPIHILTTGGTIDKVYFDAKGAYHIGSSMVDEILTDAHVKVEYTVESILQKDSLDITDADRAHIVAAVAKTTSDRILITHGTDTIVKTALAILEKQLDKTVVLTGSLLPSRFKDSDAVFNVGCAFTAVQVLPKGVWVVINGEVFDPLHVKKDLNLNRFVKA